jgi:small subunit ribosomal protein S6
MFVLRPDLGEAGINEQIERVRRVLAEHGATDIELHDWGMRDLAYRIEAHSRGHYFVLQYAGTAVAVAEVERALKLSDQVLRFMSVRQDNTGSPQLAASLARRPPEAEPQGEGPVEESLGGDA